MTTLEKAARASNPALWAQVDRGVVPRVVAEGMSYLAVRWVIEAIREDAPEATQQWIDQILKAGA